jgi:hypothetical protein
MRLRRQTKRNWLGSKHLLVALLSLFLLFLGQESGKTSAPSLTYSISTGLPLFYSGTYGVYPEYAVSSDGKNVIAAHDYLYRSTNYGASWDTITAVNSPNVSSVWSSADGTKLFATVYNGLIWKSTNSGSTWASVGTTRNWYSISASDDGTKVFAVEYGGLIYVSTDSGATWAAKTSTNKNWTNIASDSTGTRIYASADNIYGSSDGGLTWASKGVSAGSCCFFVSTSGDGKNVFFGANGNGFYLSTDYGSSFSRQTAITTTSRDAPNVWGYGSSISRDGTQLIALSLGDYVWLSNDTGTSWVKQTNLTPDAWAGLPTITNDGRVVLGAADYNWWTFTAKTFYYPGPAGGPSTITISANSTSKKRLLTSITATLSNPGTVSFYENGRIIAGCKSILTATTSASCPWLPQIQGPRVLSAKLVPTDTNYYASSSNVQQISIGKRTSAR